MNNNKKQKSKRKILLVDDEPDSSTIFRIALEDNGFDVDAFNDSTLALSAFKPNSYDLVVLDIKMPKMNGYELCEKIKKIDDKVKVCFLTESEEQYSEEIKTSFSAPTSSSFDITLIRKPVMLDELVKKVDEITT
jgi:DNA-binding response OmpR family regulator